MIFYIIRVIPGSGTVARTAARATLSEAQLLAMEDYADAGRVLLNRELGLEPSRQLQELYRSILLQDLCP